MKSYAAYCLNDNIVKESSSGGIFSLIANKILEQNGIVYGAMLNDKLDVIHCRINNKNDIKKLRGSKYIQSLLKNTYQEAKQDLEAGRYVLYTGTPCQIAGLKQFLKKDYENLYTQDIICHGTPTIYSWKKYIEYLENKYKSKLIKINFRDKSKGWLLYQIKLEFENGKIVKEDFRNNIYMKAFLKNINLRKSCYTCKHKTVERESDITIADFWGIQKICPELYNKQGTSLVIVQSEKGKKLFDSIKEFIKYTKVDIEEILQYNSSMIKSAAINKNREKFFKLLEEDFNKAVKKCIPKEGFLKRIIVKLKIVIKKIIKI